MILNIAQLKKKWSKEKSSYIKQEVGSGVQKFVKEMLKSPEVFKLKEGYLSTKIEKRRNEFIEEARKLGHRADVVIFVDSDIVIPMEIEKYKNIDAGIQQLLQYQIDWDKKYGILTDGYIWRFYNNNIYRQFTLQEIFDKTDYFLTFWQEYTKSEYYYLSFFEPKGQLTFLHETEISVDLSRRIFFDDITNLICSFIYKLKLAGYLKSRDKQVGETRAIEITYAYIIQFILYKTLVDNEFGSFEDDYKKRIGKIHSAIKNNNFKDILGIVSGISRIISKNIYRSFAREQELINNKLLELFNSIENTLSDVSPWLDILVFIKKYSFANVRNEIFGYVYENYLKELYKEDQLGQYFTDPAIVSFMLDQIGYTRQKIAAKLKNQPKDNYISLIDPACGSGTFLYSATNRLIQAVPNGTEESSKLIERLINNNIFGLDIADFPLYLAEMSILMRMLPLIIHEKYNNPIDKKIKVFWTEDSISEFMDTALRDTVFVGQLKMLPESFQRDEDDLAEMKKSLEEQPKIPRRRFDYVLGNPPYVNYNKCSKQGLKITRLIQSREALMNNVYGVNLNTVPGRIKAYAPKPNLYAFFIALGLALLKKNGRFSYIIPQTILTAADHDVLRYHLSKFTTIEKIFIFCTKMFVGRGLKQQKTIPTSSLIFVLSNNPPKVNHEVEVVSYKNPDDDVEECLENIRNGKNIHRHKIRQQKLLHAVANWNFIKHTKKEIDFIDIYNDLNETMDVYREYAISRRRFNDIFIIDGSYNIPTKSILTTKIKKNIEYYEIPVLNPKYYAIKSLHFYPKDAKIKIAKGGQGLKVVNTRYKVLWRYANPNRFYFIEGNNILPRFQQFCIGSNNRKEIIYLLALLNSNISNFILEKYLRNENEKDILVGVKAIKEFIRVPRISDVNRHIKQELIKQMEDILQLENVKLHDLVDFSKVMMQKFETIEVKANHLILTKGGKQVKCKIKKGLKQVRNLVAYLYDNKLFPPATGIRLNMLKQMPAIDKVKIEALRNYTNDLIFALYFQIPIKKIEFNRAKIIKNACKKNQYYRIVSK